MNKLIVALIASAFATAVFAQDAMKKLETPKDKTKQGEVQSATQAGTDATATQEQEKKGVAEGKGAKGTPKALTGTKEKQAATAGTTSKEAEGVAGGGRAAGAQADKDKANKAEKKPLTTTKEKQEAVEANKSKATP